MPPPRVAVEFRNSLAVLTLADPKKRNAIGLEMAEEIVAACAEIERRECSATVIRGADGFFCSGADRTLLERAASADTDQEAGELLDQVYASFIRVGALSMPVVAAIRGGAVGAGLNLALAADVRIVAEDAELASGFRDIGLHQGGGHGHLLSRLAGPEVATAMIVFGERLTGKRARDIGIAWEAVPDAEVESRALQLAAAATSDPRLTRTMTASIRGGHADTWQAWIDAERPKQVSSLRRRGRDVT